MRDLFVTRLWEEDLSAERGFADLRTELEAACRMLAAEDRAGRAWSRANDYGGYTSYASLDDLPRRATVFARLERRLARSARRFADALAFDLGERGRLRLDSLWVSVLRRGAGHGAHIHPASVLSGVVYVATPPGAGGLRLEDPRLSRMMAAPPVRADAPESQRRFVTLTPAPGRLWMWESWLRHEVLPGSGKGERISISFNYA
jgi:uncharacterized protein (TIGR02466 family)